MPRKLKIAIISVMMLGTASAAMARSLPQHNESYYACQTDEGGGRVDPCDGGNV